MRQKIIIFLLIIGSNCFGQVFQQTNPSGQIIYSDTPLNDEAKQIAVPTINQTTGSDAISETSSIKKKVITVDSKASNEPYLLFQIESPKNGETIQNQPIIPVKIKIEPELDQGDTIQLLLDGKNLGPPLAKTVFELKEIDRGTHQLSAYVIGKNQQILNQSSVITIYVHHASISSIKQTGGRAPTAPAAP